jgi:hypothetical protein
MARRAWESSIEEWGWALELGSRNLSFQTKMGELRSGNMGVRLSPECSVSKWLITEVGCKLRTPEISLVRSIKVQRGRV